MKLFSRLISITLLCSAAMFLVSTAAACPDIKKATKIGEELTSIFQKKICPKEIKLANIAWIRRSALPKIMNKAFLGVEPPANWQTLVDELVRDCYQTGDLCSQAIQSEFADCAMGKNPSVIFQLSSWFADNCEKINAAVIQNWGHKKVVVMNLINKFTEEL